MAAQIAFVLFALLLLAAVPPSHGPMLLVPVDRAAAARLVPLAIARDARMLAPGPLPLSLVVYGDRGLLVGPMLKAGILVLASPRVGCSAALAGAKA